MAITDSQKVDLLYKKVGFGVAKTDTSTYKSPSNESNASPFLTRGDTIWQQAVSVPTTIPVSNSSAVVLYQDALTSTIECVSDTTSHPQGSVYPTWLTNLQDWIPPLFGSTYQVKVYAANPGITNPQTAGTQLFADGSGNNDSWYFDYQSGILNFPDTNIPTALTSGKHIYIVGARYVGQKGLSTFPSLTIGNITISGNTITGNNNVTINGNITSSYFLGNVVGNIGGVQTLTTLTVTGNTTTGNILTNGLFYANGNPVLYTNYGNANVTAYLPTYRGNLYPGNITSTFYGNVYTDYIASNTANVISIASTSALGLPIGDTLARPTSPSAGLIRYNNEIGSIEVYNGASWVSLTNSVGSQDFFGDGVNTTYTLTSSTTTIGILVSINGTVQQPGLAYSVTGNQITFAEIPQTTDAIDIRFLATSTTPVFDTITIQPTSIAVTTANTIVDSFDISLIRSAKYVISSTTSTDAHMAEIGIVQFSGSTVLNAHSILNTGANTITYYANINGSTVNLLAQGTTSSAVRIQRTYFSI